MVPACGLANNLSWAKERSAVALANYVPCAPVEAERIARSRVGQVVSCLSDDSSMTSMEGEELWFSDAPSMSPPMDMDHEVGEESEKPVGSEEGGHSSGWKWPPKVLGIRRPCGTNCSPHSHQGRRVRLSPWPSILWLHGSGTSRCEGRACAHLLPPPSTLASFLLMRRQRGVWESHTGLWPTSMRCSRWVRWPVEESGM